MLQQQAGDSDITVLIGGSVDEHAIRTVCETTQLRAFHAGRAARLPQETWGNVDENCVAALHRALAAFCLP